MLQLFEIDDKSHLHDAFSKIFLIKHVSLKPFYSYIKLLQSSTIFKQRDNPNVSFKENFCLKFFITPNSKNVIATLHIVTTKKPKLTFFLLL